MQFRLLGSTGINVSALSFGAGPISGLMTNGESAQGRETIERALELGVNLFDTAATYGGGNSERNLGRILRELGAADRVHVATKVRLLPEHHGCIREHVRGSLRESLARLGLPRVTLLQVHNSITAHRGDEPTSITPQDVLGPGGMLEAFDDLRSDGLVEHFGLTGLGQPDTLRAVIRSAAFATIQIPYSLLNPSAGRVVGPDFAEANYGNVIADTASAGMGVFAIRVFAGGALVGAPPSPYTYKTKFFPLDLYRRDERRAARWRDTLNGHLDLKEAAVRFALSHPGVSSAIIGFGAPSHVDEALRAAQAGPLPVELLERLEY